MTDLFLAASIVINILASDTAVKKLTGNRIYPTVAKIDTPQPFIVIQRTSWTPGAWKMGGYTTPSAIVSATIGGDTYGSAVDLAMAVRSCIDDATIDGISISVTNASEDFQDKLFTQTLTILLEKS
jgi:hypothetical protein